MLNEVITETRYQVAREYESAYWNSRQRDPVGFLHDIEGSYHLALHLQKKGYFAKRYRKLIDIGCGGLGMGTLWLLQADEVVGLDPLPIVKPETGCAPIDSLIRSVQSKTNYITARAESLPFDDHYFDLVVCNNVLDHVHKPMLILREIKRVLGRDGLFAFSVDTHSFRTYLQKKIMKKISPNFGSLPGHPYEWTQAQMSAILESTGFSIESEKVRSVKGRALGRVMRATWLLRHQ